MTEILIKKSGDLIWILSFSYIWKKEKKKVSEHFIELKT